MPTGLLTVFTFAFFVKMLLRLLLISSICVIIGSNAIVYPCKTPEDEPSYCVSLFSCPHLMKALGSTKLDAINYVKESICLGCEVGDFMVCCGTPHYEEQQTITKPKPAKTKPIENKLMQRFQAAVKQRLLPDYSYCGYQHNDDRLYNSSETAIDEFPWLVHIRFSHLEYEQQFADRCNGVIINNRYVLTNANCAAEAIKVKLGEYNTNKTVSCDSSSSILDCTEPVLDLSVEEIIRDGKLSNGEYDFALLRLNQTFAYSDYIRPICLPVDQSQRPNLHSVVISGWGAQDNTGVPKKRLVYNIVENELCFKKQEYLEKNVKSANVSFVCSTPISNQGEMACSSEHGGPFMYDVSQRHQWFVDGIIVNVMYDDDRNWSNTCSSHNPINGLKITEDTIDWILSTIRP